MTETKYDKKSFRKYIYTLVSIHQKSRLIHPFSKTVTVSTTFLDKNIKYWKINCKKHSIRLKTLINNDFLLNDFQIIA